MTGYRSTCCRATTRSLETGERQCDACLNECRVDEAIDYDRVRQWRERPAAREDDGPDDANDPCHGRGSSMWRIPR